MPIRPQSTLAMTPGPRKQSGFLTSLAAWGLGSGVCTKGLWLVLSAWARLVFSFVFHGISGTLPDRWAWYWLAMLLGLTWTLYQAIRLQWDAKKRTLELFYNGVARFHLGPA